MLRIVAKLSLIGICILAFSSFVCAQSDATARAGSPPQPVAETDRSRDGLIGPVRRVRTAVSKLVMQDGKQVESKPLVLEIVAYDLKGNKVENQYFPIAGATLTGKEVYKYDERGNISEMTLVNADGSLLGKESYKYEYDFAGNWNKMTTSVAVTDGGRIIFEPTEVTYRSIMYYLDENMVKMVTPGSTPTETAANPNPAPTGSANDVPPKTPSSKQAARKNAGNVVAPLPTANTSSTRLTSTGSVEANTAAVNGNDDGPIVNLNDEPPPTPAAKPTKPVSGGVLNGTAISLPQPVYPDAARRMKLQGLIVVEVILDETGKVISAEATSGPAMLRDAALKAAKRARFSPTKLSGMPVKVSGVINYKFALAN